MPAYIVVVIAWTTNAKRTSLSPDPAGGDVGVPFPVWFGKETLLPGIFHFCHQPINSSFPAPVLPIVFPGTGCSQRAGGS